MPANLTIGFLGGGKMATALAKGFINAKLAKPSQLIASDPYEEARKHFIEETGAKAVATNAEVAEAAQTLFLAVKPDQVSAVLQEISPHFSKKHLLISIAAGVTIARLESGLPSESRVVRVMPNTPALIGL